MNIASYTTAGSVQECHRQTGMQTRVLPGISHTRGAEPGRSGQPAPDTSQSIAPPRNHAPSYVLGSCIHAQNREASKNGMFINTVMTSLKRHH